MILGIAPFRRTTIPATLLLSFALVLSGCKHAAAPAAGVRNSDGSITNADGSITYPAGTIPSAPVQTPTRNADGSITNPDGSVTYPAGSTRAEKAQQSPAPQAVQTQTQPAPVERQAPPPPPPVLRVVRSGAAIPVTITETLSASRNNAGDTFTGVLRRDVTTASGEVVFARGTQVYGVIAAAKGKGRFKGAGDLAIELTRIGGTRVSTTEYEAVNKGRGKRTAGFVGGGGGLGAIIGGIAGGGKGALIGGLAGAGAGTAGAAYTGNRDVVIPSESAVTFTLTEAISVR
ncbi:hypothetical protein [Granulicella arctica]|uniref:hypothetical protein n=1 Tax=Granulicella arctica TaxID=940613 RepID=UPI0021E05F70|nr:hypothetical protein [Granulicella arctica]